MVVQGGIIILLDSEAFELLDSRTRVYFVCYLLRSVQGNFVWGLIGIYGPNDDTLRVGLWEELEKFFFFVGYSLVFRRGFQCG